jgi:hypothetical protein
VTGTEVDTIAQTRNWTSELPPSMQSADFETLTSEINSAFQNGKFNNPATALDYLALGLPIPQEIIAFDQFIVQHEPQLKIMGLPNSLWRILYNKISNDLLDAGNSMELQYDEGYMLVPRNTLENDVFLVDHAWLFQFAEARKQLRALPNLVERFFTMMVILFFGKY